MQSKESLFKRSKPPKAAYESSNSPDPRPETRPSTKLPCFNYIPRNDKPPSEVHSPEHCADGPKPKLGKQDSSRTRRRSRVIIARDLFQRARKTYDFVSEYRDALTASYVNLEYKNGFCSDKNRVKVGLSPLPNHDDVTHLSRH